MTLPATARAALAQGRAILAGIRSVGPVVEQGRARGPSSQARERGGIGRAGEAVLRFVCNRPNSNSSSTTRPPGCSASQCQPPTASDFPVAAAFAALRAADVRALMKARSAASNSAPTSQWMALAPGGTTIHTRLQVRKTNPMRSVRRWKLSCLSLIKAA